VILSVVIPSRDKRELLARTLAALRAQDPGTDAWEIVVVDDESRDDTPRYLEETAAAEPRLRHVRPPRNLGRAGARNLGWQQARGRWVLFLDDDILAPPGLLRAHLQVLQGDPAAGTIGPAVTAPEIVDAPHFRYLDTRGVAKLPAGPAPAKYFVTQNAAVPREALVRIGGFDEGFSAYGFEDMDIGFRLEDAGVRFQALPAPVPLHIHHHTLAQYLAKKRVCGHGSLQQVAARHPGRLSEMRLDLVVDAPGERPGPGRRLVRAGLRGAGGALARTVASAWPARGGRPLAEPVYFRVLDAAVLAEYCRGLADSPSE
jgi:glycosyltransferase involved in cell wall biosynthesis